MYCMYTYIRGAAPVGPDAGIAMAEEVSAGIYYDRNI